MNNANAHGLIPLPKGISWAGLYAFIVILPLLMLLIGSSPSGISYWWDFAIALGFGAAAILILMSLLTARFTLITGPFGIDAIYYFHRQISFIALFLIIAHPLILFLKEPLLGYEIIQPGSFVTLLGVTAFILVIVQVFLATGRCWIRLDYDNWRRIHFVIGSFAVLCVFSHLASAAYYTGTQLQVILWSLYALIWFVIVVYVRAIKPARQLKNPYEVTGVKQENSNTWSLTLMPKGHAGLSFQPGQFAWISIKNSPFALAEHPFSFSSSAVKEGIGFTIKEQGDFSATIKNLGVGQRVHVDGPYGVFSVENYPSNGYVFIAGGIGIAPMMSMLRTMADRNEKQPLLLIYGSRSPESAIFAQELQSLKNLLNLEVVHVYSEPPPDWEGDIGMIDEMLLARYITKQYKEYDYFICGPVVMMKSVEKSLLCMGISYKQLHSEIFNFV